MAVLSNHKDKGRVFRSVRHIEHKGEYATIRMIVPGIDHVGEPKPVSPMAILSGLIVRFTGRATMTGLVIAFMIWGLYALGLLAILFAGFWGIPGAIDVARLIRKRIVS